jgi:hypothetical protein
MDCAPSTVCSVDCAMRDARMELAEACAAGIIHV